MRRKNSSNCIWDLYTFIDILNKKCRKLLKSINKYTKERALKMKTLESLAAVHTHTHTHTHTCNFINKKIEYNQGKIVSIFKK